MYFRKYLGRFGKYEAEVVQEILDDHDGDREAARITVCAALDRVMAHGVAQEIYEEDLQAYRRANDLRTRIKRFMRRQPAPILPVAPAPLDGFAQAIMSISMITRGDFWGDGLRYLENMTKPVPIPTLGDDHS
jgi:hypothetical protein